MGSGHWLRIASVQYVCWVWNKAVNLIYLHSCLCIYTYFQFANCSTGSVIPMLPIHCLCKQLCNVSWCCFEFQKTECHVGCSLFALLKSSWPTLFKSISENSRKTFKLTNYVDIKSREIQHLYGLFLTHFCFQKHTSPIFVYKRSFQMSCHIGPV